MLKKMPKGDLISL